MDGPHKVLRLARSTRKCDFWRGGRDRESQLIGKASRDDRGRSTAVYEGAAAGPIEQHGYGVVVGACSVADEGAVLMSSAQKRLIRGGLARQRAGWSSGDFSSVAVATWYTPWVVDGRDGSEAPKSASR